MNSKIEFHADCFADDLVLIADDEPSQREMMQATVKGTGRRVILAEDGARALELFIQYKPGLVLMDINMPHMDGIRAMQAIKQAAGEYYVPVILTSVARDKNILESVVQQGADGFLDQPFCPDLLRGLMIWGDRNRNLFNSLRTLSDMRQRESEVAEALFSGALESPNVALDKLRIYKRPAEIFSGDIQLTAYRPDGELHILLGDFTGHGLTATLGALPLSETFRAMTAKGYEGETIIRQINSKLCSLLPTGMFLSLLFISLDTQTASARILNAGMPDLLVLRPGDVPLHFASSMPPLGIIEQLSEVYFTPYKCARDETLLLISDGVSEATNTAGQLFGEARVYALAQQACDQGKPVMEALLGAVDRFTQGQALRDDLSLIEIPVEHFWSDSNPEPAPVNTQEQPACRNVCFDDEHIQSQWYWSMRLEGQSLQRGNLAAQAVAQIQNIEGEGEHWQQVYTVLTELYINALDHGVMQLNSELKSSSQGFAYYYSLREDCLENLREGSVEVRLKHAAYAGGGRLWITIEDSGAGFDSQQWLNGHANSSGLSGRGIKLVNSLCDSLRYSHGGRCAEAVYTYCFGQGC